jgi:K+-sensing histidine kinase KdpD
VDNAGVDTTTTTPGRVPRRQGAVRRGWLGAVFGVAGLAGVTLALLLLRQHLSLAGVTLLYLVPVVAAAVAGGVWPALTGAVAADLLVNFFFLPPYHTLVVERPRPASRIETPRASG